MRSQNTIPGAIGGWVLALVVGVSLACGGDAGLTLDPAFRPAVTTTRDTVLFAVAVQPDGRVLVAGDFALVGGVPRQSLARLHTDGSVDSSFDSGLGVEGLVYALAVQPADNKILLAGEFTAVNGIRRRCLARLNSDGSVDPAFEPAIEGREGCFVSTLLLQPDGRILVGGNFNSAGGLARPGLARLTPTGHPDRSFDPGLGLEGGVALDLALQADGCILVGGSFARVGGLPRAGLARVHSNGQVDASFNGGVYADGGAGRVYAISVHPVRGIVVAGVFDQAGGAPRPGLARLGFNGRADATFDPQAGVAGGAGAPYDLVSLPGGEVLVTGSFWYAGGVERAGLARLTAEGAADTAFEPGPGLAAQGDAFGNMLALQPDGKVLVVGQFEEAGGVRRHCLARFSAAGDLDPSFSNTNSFFEFGGTVRAILPLPGGGVLVGGEFERVNGRWRHGLAELTEEGRLVLDFDAQLNPGAVVHALARQPDGRVLVGGWFERVAEAERENLARLLPGGALDEGFRDYGAEAAVRTLACLADGRILVGGSFRQFGDLRRFGLVRLAADGEPDPGFDARFEIGLDRSAVLALAVLPEGGLLAGGYFDSVNGEPRSALARLNADGSLDREFDAGLVERGSVPTVTSLVLRGDGRFVVGGRFFGVNGRVRHGLARLYADGRLDACFDPGRGIGGGEAPTVEALALLGDGQLAVGGTFTSFNGQPVARLALLSRHGGLPLSPAASDDPESPVFAVAVEADSSLLAGGAFSQVAGQLRLGLARFLTGPAWPEIRVAVTASSSEIEVHWDGEGRLFEAEGLAGPWRVVPGASSPLSRTASAGARFYRLIK